MKRSCSQPALPGRRHNPGSAILAGALQSQSSWQSAAEGLPQDAGRRNGALQAARSAGPFFFRVNVSVLSGHLEVIELFRLYNTRPFAVHCRKQLFIIYHKLLRAVHNERWASLWCQRDTGKPTHPDDEGETDSTPTAWRSPPTRSPPTVLHPSFGKISPDPTHKDLTNS